MWVYRSVVGYHGIDTERLHSSAHPSLVVANTQFSSTILIRVKSLLLGAIPEPDTYWRHSLALTYTTSSDKKNESRRINSVD